MEESAKDDGEDVLVTDSMRREEAKLLQQSADDLLRQRQQALQEYDEQVEQQRYSRLTFLLQKTTIYSTFLRQKLEQQQQQQRTKRRLPVLPVVEEDTHPKKAKKDSEKGEEKQEQDKNGGSLPSVDEEAAVSVSDRQPKMVTGGVLREYQLVGMEWMISLFENGLNGILGDEMGLGKTIQCISFLSFLREKGVWGPFLIVAPLSTLSNWVAEFHRFTPAFPVVLYHGSIEERGKIRQQRMKKLGVEFPAIVTSYEIVMNDRKHLQRFNWKYIIVDEGHRIKNLNCRLIQELKSYKSANRMLMTGTPLQNNLAELWSLLNFLLPDIFDDLASFQSWFDFSDVDKTEGKNRIMEGEAKNQIVSKLHHILEPFLLRRLKVDVEKELPKKKEYLLLAPLTDLQREYYEAALHRNIRQHLLGRSPSNGHGSPSKRHPAEKELETSEKGLRITARKNYKELPDTKYFKKLQETIEEEERILEEENEEDATADAEKSAPTSADEKFVGSLKLQNLIMQLRKICNHPYLFDYPVLKDGLTLRIDEDLVKNSGKFLFLDRLMPALLERGHKMTIFSQMTRMLDILGDYLELRGHKYCRIDGAVNYVDRAEQIETFNTDPSIRVFILSTRAGGLGINLTAADTCIIFDSDWNPQMDLQAQDRVHRIGQTKPVVVYRLCTQNAAEQKILERANAKRKLEKLVIHKDSFKLDKLFSKGSSINVKEIYEILKSDEREHVRITSGQQIISDAELERILDRSPAVFEASAAVEEGKSFQTFDSSVNPEDDLAMAGGHGNLNNNHHA